MTAEAALHARARAEADRVFPTEPSNAARPPAIPARRPRAARPRPVNTAAGTGYGAPPYDTDDIGDIGLAEALGLRPPGGS